MFPTLEAEGGNKLGAISATWDCSTPAIWRLTSYRVVHLSVGN